MDVVSLKEYIYSNNKVEYVLSEIGCHHIKYHQGKEFYSCGNYNGDNVGAINVKNNKYLDVKNWTRPKEFGEGSDIIDLVQYNKQCSFIDSVKYLHKILELKYTGYKKNKKDKNQEDRPSPLRIFDRIKKSKMCGKPVDVADIHVIDDEAINDYVPLLHISWLRDGIMPWSAKRFSLAYSYRYKRVIIPHRHWLTGQLLGFNERTTVENYDELGIRKYYLTEGMNKSLNLYGLYEHHDDIQKAGYVVVYEAERSVLKRDSLNDHTGVALSGKIMSDEQVRILMGLNVKIVIAFDNDVDINEIRHACEKFYHKRSVSYIKDNYDLLGDKDSPADAKNKIFNFLLKYRTVYDESEHKKYLDSLAR